MLPVDDYREILAKVDDWYRSVKERHPEQVAVGERDVEQADAAVAAALGARNLGGMALLDGAVPLIDLGEKPPVVVHGEHETKSRVRAPAV